MQTTLDRPAVARDHRLPAVVPPERLVKGRSIVCTLPWVDTRTSVPNGYVWRLATFWRAGAVISVDAGRPRQPVTRGIALPTDADIKRAEVAYARHCWRYRVDPLGRLDVQEPPARQRTFKRSWHIHCIESMGVIRVSGRRCTRSGAPVGPYLPAAAFPEPLRELLEITDGNRLGGWTKVFQLVHDLTHFANPQVKVVRGATRGDRTWLRVHGIEETETYRTAADLDTGRHIRKAASRQLAALGVRI